MATVAGLVAGGLGVGMVPDFPGLGSLAVQKLRVSAPACRRVIGMAWMESRTLSPAAERFRRFVAVRAQTGRGP